jgi:hypothetical protein
VYTAAVACIYNVDRKCKGMLTPERLNILQRAFDGLHDNIHPPPVFTDASPPHHHRPSH